jgi:YidC/Oxa1 family membrane protein insertase
MLVLSILSPLENLLKHVLSWLHTTVGLPWAWSIVALTVIVRMILVPLTVRQIHSMQRLQQFAPQMKEIQRKYKGDRQRMNQEMMQFYKEHQINPASSCLPLLAQFPVFISLYLVLKHYQFKGNVSWLIVPDITAHANSHWSGYVLIAIYAGSQIASTLFMSTTMDKTQRRILLFLPLVFITVVIRFPTGLVLYWVTTNLWTVGQGLITRRLVPKTPAPPLGMKRTSRAPAKAQADGKPKAQEPADSKPAAQQPQVRKVKRKKKRSSGRR